MATNVVMPQMGESIAEGTIVRWIKKVGDNVDRDEPLFEISTDKVDAEIPSPGAGVLTEIKVKEGETVPVNSVVAVIGGTVGSGASRGARAGAGRAHGGAAGGRQSVSRKPPSRRLTARSAGTRRASAPRRPDADEVRRQRSSPLVRRIAKEHNVDIRSINGTGISGRVTKNDILGFIETGLRDDAARGAGRPRRPRVRSATFPRSSRATRSRSCR